MSGGFRELENITADLGIEAWGLGLEDAFTSAVHGLASLLSDSSEGDQPLADYQTLDNELRKYKDELATRQRLIILNKIDQINDQKILNDLTAKLKDKGFDVISISALTGQGIDSLKETLADMMAS